MHTFCVEQRKEAQRPHVKRPLVLPSDDMEQVNELVLQVRGLSKPRAKAKA